MFKLLYNFTHFTCQQGNAQNPSNQNSAVYELPDVQTGFTKGRDQILNICQIKFSTFVRSQRKQGNFRKTSISSSLTMLKLLTVWITTNCRKFLEMGITDHLTCLLTHIQVSQETGKMVWYSHLSKSFLQFVVIHTVKCFI